MHSGSALATDAFDAYQASSNMANEPCYREKEFMIESLQLHVPAILNRHFAFV